MRELPVLQRLADELAPKGLALVTVALNSDATRAERTAARIGLTAPVMLGDDRLRETMRVAHYPWTIVVGRDGRAILALRGAHDEDRFRAAFERALAGG